MNATLKKAIIAIVAVTKVIFILVFSGGYGCAKKKYNHLPIIRDVL